MWQSHTKQRCDSLNWSHSKETLLCVSEVKLRLNPIRVVFSATAWLGHWCSAQTKTPNGFSPALFETRFLQILLQRSISLSILQSIKSLFLPSPSHPLLFAAFFPSSRPLLHVLLPTPSFSIHISGGRLHGRACASAPFWARWRPTSSPPAPPSPG